MIGIFGLDGSGVIDAEEYLAAGQLSSLRDQGLDQGLRLGAGLAPDNSVSGPNDVRQVDHRTMLTAGPLSWRGRRAQHQCAALARHDGLVARVVDAVLEDDDAVLGPGLAPSCLEDLAPHANRVAAEHGLGEAALAGAYSGRALRAPAQHRRGHGLPILGQRADAAQVR